MPGAVRSRPKTSGPACRTSRVNAGSRAVAPPNSTANRSSDIAPSTVLRRHTKRSPSSSVAQLTATDLAALRRAPMVTRLNTANSSIRSAAA